MLNRLLRHLLPERLHKAARDGDLSRMRNHIAAGWDVNAADKQGATPLFHTANKGMVEAAKLLLDSGADVNHRAARGGMPLHSALLGQHADLAFFLMDNGADIHGATDPGVTPLHVAVLGGLEAVADRLIREGADVNAVTASGQSVLMFALLGLNAGKTDDPACLRMLLATGADPETGSALAEGIMLFNDEVRELFGEELKTAAAGPRGEKLRQLVRRLSPDPENEQPQS